MNVVKVLRRLVRVVTPPGNRAALDSAYRQPNADATHVSAASAAHQQQQSPSS